MGMVEGILNGIPNAKIGHIAGDRVYGTKQ